MNRREVLTGMALASAATVIPAAAVAASNAQPDRAAGDRAMAELNRAKAASDAFDEHLTRVDEAYRAAAGEVPHATVEKYGRTISTADRDEVARARSSCKSLRYVETCAYEGARADQQLVDAADARDAQLKAIDQQVGWRAANDHYDALTDGIVEAEQVLLNIPAPDGETLLWKVNRLYAEGS